ncbi:TPA: hypothetical protein QEM76_000196 [Pseudomonas putida]|uniref:DUF6731 family protein n=1 Tax=Pseudomonas putida TaxID=303 RepID=UPI001554C7A6|nr:DUF6731 family protein [Pseudomonas putida]HDS1797562.1 hypothetical protein [Pseudomonas putida]HDS1803543.1 hypothetical protein [Pseudomonas putida]
MTRVSLIRSETYSQSDAGLVPGEFYFMVDAVQEKKYVIDFFALSFQPTATVPSIEGGLKSLVESDSSRSLAVNGYTREIWKPLERVSDTSRSFAGQFRKFRTSDLPEIGAAGEDAAELELEANQGLVERNFFVFYPQRQVLAWCRNAHGNTPNQFARFLSNLWSTKLQAGPILLPDAARRLMGNEISLKKIKLVIPRPANPDMYNENEFNKGLMSMMSGADADSIHIEMGIDARRSDTRGSLSERLKRALAEAANLGASTAKAVVYDDGIEHPIDLIADRIFSVQEIVTNAKYPPAGTMYQAIDSAMHECQGQIDDYFGSMEDSVA